MKQHRTSKYLFFTCVFLGILSSGYGQSAKGGQVPEKVMQEIFEEIKTPYKYGVVIPQPDSKRMVDSPTIFRKRDTWYMTYITFDGRGYETWLAQSKDLLQWKQLGRIMSFTENTWDATQKAGYVALVDTKWGGSYEPKRYKGKHWISYLVGSEAGYEAGRLGIGMAKSADLTRQTGTART